MLNCCAQLLKKGTVEQKIARKNRRIRIAEYKNCTHLSTNAHPPICVLWGKNIILTGTGTVTYPTVPVVRKDKWFLTKKCIRIIVDNSTNYFVNVDYYRKICTYIRMNACTPLTFLTILKILPAGFVLIRSHCHTTQWKWKIVELYQVRRHCTI